jgi:Domain of unknown function (DUF4383)
MIAPHSTLHIVTGLAALGLLAWGGKRGTFWFSVGFGLFYSGLALLGMITMQPTALGLQPFDHPFHLLVGGLGLAAAGLSYGVDLRKKASL